MTAAAPSDPQSLPHLVNDYKDQDSKDRPTVELTVVVPAYNESNRIESMLRSAVEFLETRPLLAHEAKEDHHHSPTLPAPGSYEILIVDDGSKDQTSEKALEIAGQLANEIGNKRGQIKVCRLVRNRGKGGATKHVRSLFSCPSTLRKRGLRFLLFWRVRSRSLLSCGAFGLYRASCTLRDLGFSLSTPTAQPASKTSPSSKTNWAP